MWRRPRKPQRNPKPSAVEFSGSKVNEASFKRSFSMASRRFAYSSASVGKSPAKTMGLASAKPGSGSAVGRRISVIVSPMRVECRSLMLPQKDPTSPTERTEHLLRLRAEDAERLDVGLEAGAHRPDLHPCASSRPSTMRTSEVTPRYASYQESKSSAFRGASGSPLGGGMSRTMRSISSSMPDAHLGRRQNGVVGGDADDLLDLLARLLGLGGGQVDLVDDRHDDEVVVGREVRVGERLRFDALGRVDDEDRALAGGERARDLVGEVDVAGRVDEVQDVLVAVLRLVPKRHGARLDRDAALLLEVHVVEHLLVHLARRDGVAPLQDAVGQRRLPVVDVGDDREVADARRVGHWRTGDDTAAASGAQRPPRAGRRSRGIRRGPPPRRRARPPTRSSPRCRS